MNKSVSDYFHEFQSEGSESGHFHKVIPLHDRKWDWGELHTMAPNLPRGWYELSQLPNEDRIEFTRDHWLAKLPFQPHMVERIEFFFSRLDTIDIFLTQLTGHEEPYEVHFVYSLGDDEGFFHGSPPVGEDDLAGLQGAFSNTILPADYCAFIRIHNGFRKGADTGLLSASSIPEVYSTLQAHLKRLPALYQENGDQVNPRSLIPFYESFGLHCYQCFWTDWFAEAEIGNVYYSGIDHCMSSPDSGDAETALAFPTFLSWLMFYLEGVV